VVVLSEDKVQLLARVARAQSGAAPSGDPDRAVSILSLAAASYGAKPADESTIPTGFDPLAVVLFEAIVEGAYLAAAADGVVDHEERHVFERVVTAACGGVVLEKQIAELVADLSRLLAEDGMDKRIAAVASQVHKKEHGREVLRIAALVAIASDDVSDVERVVLEKLASAFLLEPSDVDGAVMHVREVLAAQTSTPLAS
jgi:tellurite resistance protein